MKLNAVINDPVVFSFFHRLEHRWQAWCCVHQSPKFRAPCWVSNEDLSFTKFKAQTRDERKGSGSSEKKKIQFSKVWVGEREKTKN